MKIIEISSYKRRKGDFCMYKIKKNIQGKSALELLEQYGIEQVVRYEHGGSWHDYL